MSKTVGGLGTDLQTIAHSGEATKEIVIKVLDSFYRVGDIKKITQGELTVYAIEARGCNEQ